MNDITFQKKLLGTFNVEAEEHLQTIAKNLLSLEKVKKSKDRETLLETVHREMHSLKGASRAVSLLDHESVCQSMERLFLEWKESSKKITIEEFDILHHIIKSLQKSLPKISIDNLKIDENILSVLQDKIKKICDKSPIKSKPSKKRAPDHAINTEPKKTEEASLSNTVRIESEKLDTLLIKSEEMLSVKLLNRSRLEELTTLGTEIKKLKKSQESFLSQINTTEYSNQLPLCLELANDNLSSFKKIESSLNEAILRFDKDNRQLNSHVDNLLDDAKKIMMLPFNILLDSFPAMVRSICRESGHEVDFNIAGGEVEIDKRILEELKTPLIHMVRNAIDHGLEDPETREKSRKPKNGQLKISISQLGSNEIEIIVSDDGKGIDTEKVKSIAVEKKLISANDAKTMDDSAALGLIYQSGISTSPMITNISGQGLGMAIVKEKILKLGGRIHVKSEKDTGTQIKISVPLTIATFKGILIQISDKKFIVPTANLERILRIKKDNVKSVEGRNMIIIEDITIPLIEMNKLLNVPRATDEAEINNHESVLVITQDNLRIAFTVDNIFNEIEVLVKKLTKPLIKVNHVSGLTILGDGSVVPILNSSDLIKAAAKNNVNTKLNLKVMTSQEKGLNAEMKKENSILLTDDSITTRSLLKNILEMAGFSVTTAVDGLDAWRLLKEFKFDLLVSDVDMPRMDGFLLTEKIRADKKLSALPVVLVTGKESREDKERGIDVGANAYITKSNFDDANLLTIIKRLL